MAQGALPFQYAEDRSSRGITGLAGLAAYLGLWQIAGLGESVSRHMGVNQGRQGWTDAQVVTSPVLLDLGGRRMCGGLAAAGEGRGVGAGAAPRNSDGNPDSPQVVVFLATFVDVTVGS